MIRVSIRRALGFLALMLLGSIGASLWIGVSVKIAIETALDEGILAIIVGFVIWLDMKARNQ